MKLLLITIMSFFLMSSGGWVHADAESLYQIRHKDQITQDWEIHAEYPLFDQLESKDLQKKVNTMIVQKLERTFRDVQREASEVMGFPVLYYEETAVYKNKEFYSVVMTTNITRGDQYNSQVTSINFSDEPGGDIHALKDFVHMDRLNKEVRAQLAQDQETYKFHNFNGVRDTTAFYVNKDKLVLVFNKYEIAAGVHGTPEIEIPLEKVKKEEKTDKTYAPLPPIV
ncbi:RsiV family protein [Halobacillus sp. BBL2006]|uniref:RsiV family protein n=1 Tax=Halobacillus sp. BBL2006 TaxID=1543706 RepID=UPI0005429B8A|nr:RsiV family protein [Halobacillus sp. BBL2006]KHE69583.1 hypothetical protein LD39_12725 [Halobacillus sp. BBL2006]